MAKKKRYYDEAMSAKDGAMIGDSAGHANMPQDVIMKYYPKDGYYLNEDINDGMSGIDMQTRGDGSEMKKGLSKTKY